jgi:hypothetical protein
MNISKILLAVSMIAVSMTGNAVVLVQTSDPGFYNDSLGTVLNLSNGGVDNAAAYFPVSNDSFVTFPVAPDLSVASGILGNWLTDPLNLNSNWSLEASIPNSWTPGDEVAVMYQFDTLGATNVVASFGVDNGIFAWLDGVYIGGVRSGGGPISGEHVFNIGNLAAGTHFLQLLLEDHGGSNGYIVDISADTFIPGPPPSVPEPSTLVLLALGLVGIGARRRRNH